MSREGRTERRINAYAMPGTDSIFVGESHHKIPGEIHFRNMAILPLQGVYNGLGEVNHVEIVNNYRDFFINGRTEEETELPKTKVVSIAKDLSVFL